MIGDGWMAPHWHLSHLSFSLYLPVLAWLWLACTTELACPSSQSFNAVVRMSAAQSSFR
jgi:hypothetical protein